MQSQRRSLVPGAAAVACIAAVAIAAGCGGGGGTTSANRVVTTPGGHSITVPNLNTTGGGRHRGGTATTTTTPSTITLPNGLTLNVGQLTPFRNCLRDHGVTPVPFGHAPRTPLPTRAEMRARIACAPKLPPALEQLYLRARRRFEQRQNCFRTHPRNRAVCARITRGLRSR